MAKLIDPENSVAARFRRNVHELVGNLLNRGAGQDRTTDEPDPDHSDPSNSSATLPQSSQNPLVERILSSTSPIEALQNELPNDPSEANALIRKADQSAQELPDSQKSVLQERISNLYEDETKSLYEVANNLFRELVEERSAGESSIELPELLETRQSVLNAAQVLEDGEINALRGHLVSSNYSLVSEGHPTANLIETAREVLRDRADLAPQERLQILQGAIEKIITDRLPAGTSFLVRDAETAERLANLTLEHLASTPVPPAATEPVAAQPAPAPAPPAPVPPAPQAATAPEATAQPTAEIAEKARQHSISVALLGRNGKIDYSDGDGNIQTINVRRIATDLVDSPQGKKLSTERMVELVSAQIYAACAKHEHFINTKDPKETVFPDVLARIEIERYQEEKARKLEQQQQAKRVNLVDQALASGGTKNVAGIGDLAKAAEHIYNSAGDRSKQEMIEALASHIREDHWVKRAEAAKAQLALIRAGQAKESDMFAQFGAAALGAKEQEQFSRLLAERIIERFPKKEPPKVVAEVPAERDTPTTQASSIAAHVKETLSNPSELAFYQKIVNQAVDRLAVEAGNPGQRAFSSAKIIAKVSEILLGESWKSLDEHSPAYAKEFARQALASLASPAVEVEATRVKPGSLDPRNAI